MKLCESSLFSMNEYSLSDRSASLFAILAKLERLLPLYLQKCLQIDASSIFRRDKRLSTMGSLIGSTSSPLSC